VEVPAAFRVFAAGFTKAFFEAEVFSRLQVFLSGPASLPASTLRWASLRLQALLEASGWWDLLVISLVIGDEGFFFAGSASLTVERFFLATIILGVKLHRRAPNGFVHTKRVAWYVNFDLTTE
jgi:hypothetical protein